MFCVVWDCSCSKRKGKKHLKSYKNEIKSRTNPGLTYSGFEQPGPESEYKRHEPLKSS